MSCFVSYSQLFTWVHRELIGQDVYQNRAVSQKSLSPGHEVSSLRREYPPWRFPRNTYVKENNKKPNEDTEIRTWEIHKKSLDDIIQKSLGLRKRSAGNVEARYSRAKLKKDSKYYISTDKLTLSSSVVEIKNY